MKVIIAKDYDEMSKKAADLVLSVVKSNPKAVLGLATGSTPLGLYAEMIKDHKENGTSYKDIKTVNLDEYAGLDYSSDQSYVYFMRKNLFDSLDIDLKNTNIENGKAADKQAECDRYNALLEKMQQDIQVLGIGSNGHIAFNEPGTPFDSVTHVVDLTESTIKDNSRLFKSIDEVPRQAFTMGLKNIMNAKKIVILANGKNKAKAVYGLVKGETTTSVPASILQNHPDCTLICDEQAAELIK
ncbi:MAG TPA: glucosamine-6-phosphate deaminase [Clostridiales bacterium]|nr:glucosamine-6-phosphate deaminase [Clostridiales bacterium]